MSALTAFERFKEKLVAEADLIRGQCYLFHAWGRWSDVSAQRLARSNGEVIGMVAYQHRFCNRCHKFNWRSEQWAIRR